MGHSWISVAGPLAQITTTGVVTEHHCAPWEGAAGTSISGPAATNDGNLWITDSGFTDSGAAYGLTPCLAGVPGNGATLPSFGAGLISGPDNNLWFALSSGASPQIGRSTKSGVVETFSLPPGTSSTLLASAADGNIWFTDYSNGKVARMTTSGSVTLFDLPTANAGPTAIAAGADGNLWFIEANANQIGRITTTGFVTEYPIPTPASQPSGIAPGADGALWFTERIGKIGRITTTGAFSEIRVPYANAAPNLIVGKPDGTIWFTDSPGLDHGSDRIGRLNPDGGCASNPQTLCLSIGAFSVTASFQRASDASLSPANAVALTGNTGYFWFFDAANVEMTVKVLDGCSVNNHYWVFAGGMTNVGVEWKVTNDQGGTIKNYSNAVGTPFQPVQDTAAFPCP